MTIPAMGIPNKVIVLASRRLSCFPRMLSEVEFITFVNIL